VPTREEVNDDHFVVERNYGSATVRARNRPFDAISPGGQKIAFVSVGAQPSNPEGDDEIGRSDKVGDDCEFQNEFPEAAETNEEAR
jgi:hypothetical protein